MADFEEHFKSSQSPVVRSFAGSKARCTRGQNPIWRISKGMLSRSAKCGDLIRNLARILYLLFLGVRPPLHLVQVLDMIPCQFFPRKET